MRRRAGEELRRARGGAGRGVPARASTRGETRAASSSSSGSSSLLAGRRPAPGRRACRPAAASRPGSPRRVGDVEQAAAAAAAARSGSGARRGCRGQPVRTLAGARSRRARACARGRLRVATASATCSRRSRSISLIACTPFAVFSGLRGRCAVPRPRSIAITPRDLRVAGVEHVAQRERRALLVGQPPDQRPQALVGLASSRRRARGDPRARPAPVCGASTTGTARRRRARTWSIALRWAIVSIQPRRFDASRRRG